MSWIKDNKFMAALAGGTLLGAALLYFIGAKGASRYEQAKADFDVAASDASSFEKLELYPRQENRDGKTKALDEYRKSLESLQAAFQAFRPKPLENISPQDFTNHLKTVDTEIRKAFDDAGAKIPDPFFCGFENYKTTLARGNATGILDYQLAGIKDLMLALSKSGVSELKNLHRPLLPEEEGSAYTPKDGDVARPLPLEITFLGPEKSVRAFLSSIVKPEGRYVVVRSIRVTNAKKDPPRAADAKFDRPSAAAPSGAAEVLAGGFVLPTDETAAETKPEAAAAPAAAPPADSSRVLSQVLGNEEVQVFLRLDLMQFLPSKKLP
jgi:hypothetical protein